jgi:hypothetical protein
MMIKLKNEEHVDNDATESGTDEKNSKLTMEEVVAQGFTEIAPSQ